MGEKWDGHIHVSEGKKCAVCGGPISGTNWTERTGQLTHKDCPQQYEDGPEDDDYDPDYDPRTWPDELE